MFEITNVFVIYLLKHIDLVRIYHNSYNNTYILENVISVKGSLYSDVLLVVEKFVKRRRLTVHWEYQE